MNYNFCQASTVKDLQKMLVSFGESEESAGTHHAQNYFQAALQAQVALDIAKTHLDPPPEGFDTSQTLSQVDPSQVPAPPRVDRVPQPRGGAAVPHSGKQRRPPLPPPPPSPQHQVLFLPSITNLFSYF